MGKWLTGVYFVSIILTLTFNVMEGNSGLVDSEVDLPLIRALTSFNNLQFNIGAIFSIPIAIFDFLNAVKDMILWNYPTIFSGPAIIVKFILLYPLSVAAVVGLIMIAQSVVQGSLRRF